MLVQKLNTIRARKEAEDRGFTLIELLVVVVIIGILIAIAIPLYLNYQKGAHDKSAQSDLRAAVSALQQCYTDNGNAYPLSIAGGSNVYTPSPAACNTDLMNVSSGTTLVYTAYSDNGTTACATEGSCTTFEIKSYNSGGHKDSATNAYDYKSWVGGDIQ